MNSCHNKSRTRHESGFTLLELLVTLLLAGIVATIGLPSFQALGERTALSASVNQLQSILAFARHTAITQRTEVTVCPADQNRSNCKDDWSAEILVIAADKTSGILPEEIIQVSSPIVDTNISKNGHTRIKFDALGHARGFNSTFTFCPSHSEEGRQLVISLLGRVRIEEQPHDCSST